MKQTIEQRVEKFIRKHQKKIPEQYNQNELLDLLLNIDIDFFISISNRSDGKTTNYLIFFILFAIEFEIPFFLVCRHFDVRKIMLENIIDACRISEDLDPSELVIKRTDFYIIVNYGNKKLCLISDLNAASDLKIGASFIKYYPIMIYDEFLALQEDYVFDEFKKLHIIYTSIDKRGKLDIISYPRIFLFGNAVNFDSPILAHLDLYDKLETQEMNTLCVYDNVAIELRKNEHANENRNTRTFKDIEDPLATGQFKFNRFNIVTKEKKEEIQLTSCHFYVKLDHFYLKITYNAKNILLKVEAENNDYIFCNRLVDMDENVKFIDEHYYSEIQHKKYTKKGYILFENSYTKNLFLGDSRYTDLKLDKLINYHKFLIKEKVIDENEDEYLDRRKQNTLIALAKKYENIG